MITYQDYKYIIPIQIRFSDIDRLNHVNNACYHNFAELGRVSYFGHVLKGHIQWDKQGFVLARTEIDHLISLYLDDEVYCCTKAVKLGNKSLTIKNSIIKKTNGEFIECASITGILVAMDYVNNLSMTIPREWRDLMEGFEK